jgi:hypothetical protein
MSHARNVKGMDGTSVNMGAKKPRGRTADVTPHPVSPTRPAILRTLKVDANRPIEPGGTKHRGDRRDMNKAYTNNSRTSANHTNPRGGHSRTRGKG